VWLSSCAASWHGVTEYDIWGEILVPGNREEEHCTTCVLGMNLASMSFYRLELRES